MRNSGTSVDIVLCRLSDEYGIHSQFDNLLKSRGRCSKNAGKEYHIDVTFSMAFNIPAATPSNRNLNCTAHVKLFLVSCQHLNKTFALGLNSIHSSPRRAPGEVV